MTGQDEITVSCLCSQSEQNLQLRTRDAADLTTLCHCDICRHASGLLFASYFPITEPRSLGGLTKHNASDGVERYFCETCGCHMFRSTTSLTSAGEPCWEVATGTVVSSDESPPDTRAVSSWRHLGVKDTKDGGLSVALPGVSFPETHAPSPKPASTKTPSTTTIPVSCACESVRFLITAPTPQSALPHSGFPDLLFPFQSTPASIAANPGDEKWWLRPPPLSPRSDGESTTTNGTMRRYLAGTCACRSCRLASGFEVQTWAFVPRANLMVAIAPEQGPGMGKQKEKLEVLDFGALPLALEGLRSYESSPGVLREFCGTCGATVFWHDKWRPDVIDFSVGLMQAGECGGRGARAQELLDWWTERTSFAEQTETGRAGFVARWARRLVDDLESGLKAWGKAREGI